MPRPHLERCFSQYILQVMIPWVFEQNEAQTNARVLRGAGGQSDFIRSISRNDRDTLDDGVLHSVAHGIQASSAGFWVSCSPSQRRDKSEHVGTLVPVIKG